MSSPVDVPSPCEAYRHALTTALQFPCTLGDSIIDRLHEQILEELISNCQRHDINCMGLRLQVEPILQQAKERNRTRKFAFDTDDSKTRGRYTFSIYGHCEVIAGNNNDGVLNEIRSWLCEFGSEQDRFQIDIYGYHSAMGKGLDRIRSELTVESLMPGLLTRNLSRGDTWEPDDMCDGKWRAVYYAQVPPIKTQFWFHDPTRVEGEVQLKSKLMKFQINGQDISASMPYVSAENVKVIFDGEIEYNVTKGIYTRKWGKFVTFGIGLAFDKTGSTTKVHKMKLRMAYPADSIKMREKIKIDISVESAEKFMKLYQVYQSIESVDHREYRQRLAIMAADLEPWRQFIGAMREGGPSAVKEMVFKKPEILQNLPNDINHAAGIAFEELQIARILAEANRRGVPLELFAGDGRGVFEFNGQLVKTPEYVDALFYNKNTNEYFAVQFKYADKPEHLVEMMNSWRDTHQTNQPAAGDVPDAVLLDNVQLIGPKDVVDQLMENGQFKSTVDVGFDHTPLEREAILKFIETNKTMLKEVVNTKVVKDNIKLRKELNTDLSTKRGRLQRLQTGLDEAKAKLQDPNMNLDNVHKEINGKQKAYDNVRNEVDNMVERIEVIDKDLRVSFKKAMDKNVLKQGATQIRNATLLGAAIDGVISLVTSCDIEIRKWTNGEISGGECVWQITKNTAIGTVRGGAMGAAFCAPEVASQIAIYHGYTATGAALSTFGKLAGPALIIGMVGYSTYSICKQYNQGDITSADAKKSMGRLVSSTILSTGGMIAAGALIAGPIGLAVGAGLVICTALGDHFLGDKLWSLIIKEDPKEREALVKRKLEEIMSSVLEAAYELFDLTEHATDEELKAAVKAARLKYHPDKGGDEEIFKAVEAAYSIIRAHRE